MAGEGCSSIIDDCLTTSLHLVRSSATQFFTNIAHTLARHIKYDGTKNLKYYLDKHILVNTVFNFENIDEETVRKTIQTLPSKNSCGLDGISSKLIEIN